MTYEVEQKFPLADATEIERALTALGGERGEEVEQVDTYYAHPSRDFGQTDEALRIRRVGARAWITYKGPKLDAETKTRREIDLPLGEGEAAGEFATLLEALGFRSVSQVRKRRRTVRLQWEGRPVEAALDRVEGLGAFVELELTADDDDLEGARGALASLTRQLGLGPGERRSYLELLLEQ